MSRANLKNFSSFKSPESVRLSNGLWNIYKPKGVTSFDVVRDIKRMMGEKKVGHAGTLDPLAEGVLIVGVGRESTKKLRFVLEEDKEYIAEIKLGMTSTTDDEEGEKTLTERFKAGLLERSDSGEKSLAFRNADGKEENEEYEMKAITNTENSWPSIEEIEKVVKTFIGDIIQISPVYSAIKIGGERAYKKARRGEKFTQPPRVVTIKEIEILDYQLKNFDEIKQVDNVASSNIQNGTAINTTTTTAGNSVASNILAGEYPVLKIKCVVGSGTYIRSLAREIGERLKTGGYLTSLVRTRIGNYKIKDSIKLK
jgi:tRNA pseudouridine55 synthase